MKRQMIYIVVALLFLISGSRAEIPSITLTKRQFCDLELLLNKGFNPLDGFMGRNSYERVLEEMRLEDGSLWPIPIVLDIFEKDKESLSGASKIALCDHEGRTLAYLLVSDIWKPDKVYEALKVYGTVSLLHPGVEYLFKKTGEYYIGGKLEKVNSPKHYDFTDLRKTPSELKSYFKAKGFEKIVGFQTRNPMHRAHLELTLQARDRACDAHLLIHPSVGMTKPGDVDYFTRVKCYRKLMNYYPEGSATLSLLPLAMRMAGPKEALWHAIIRKNYGCTHFIVGRDHAGPGKNEEGKDFYDPYAAQELVKHYAKEIGIEVLPFQEMVYVKEDENYQPMDEVLAGKTILRISGTELRRMLREGKMIPDWFSFPDVVSQLEKTFPKRKDQGITVLLTGGTSLQKKAIARAFAIKLMELQDRVISILDDKSLAVLFCENLADMESCTFLPRLLSFTAAEINKNHGITILSWPLSFEEDRQSIRAQILENGNFIEVYLGPDKEREFEPPNEPEINLEGLDSIETSVNFILDYLKDKRYLL